MKDILKGDLASTITLRREQATIRAGLFEQSNDAALVAEAFTAGMKLLQSVLISCLVTAK